jgi:Predicted transcriptional regulators
MKLCSLISTQFIITKYVKAYHVESVFRKGENMNYYQSSDAFLSHLKEIDTHNSQCPLTYALDLISGKWEIKILFFLLKYETLRFGQLKAHLPGITNTVLTGTLKKLEQMGIVKRIQFNEIPPHVEYSLMKAGKDLLPIFMELAKWGEQHHIEEASENRGW